MLITQLSVTVIIIFGYSNVFFLPYDFKLELFNEFTILMCIYHCYLFTDFVPQPETRYSVGFSLIGCTVFNFSVNGYFMASATVK